jgi:transposase InsO family protein
MSKNHNGVLLHGDMFDDVSPEDEVLSPLVANLLDICLNVVGSHEFVEDIARYLDSENNTWECSEHLFEDFEELIPKFSLLGEKIYFNRGRWKSLYLPLEQRSMALVRFHDELGHLSFKSVQELVERRYYWPTLEKDFRNYIISCAKCQRARGSLPPAHPCQPLPPVGHPFERWGIDFVQNLPLTEAKNRHIITCIDYATRWVVAEPVQRMDSESVIKFLYLRIFMNYGIPFEIVSDRGGSFMSEETTQFLNMYSVKHLPSSSYHPQTNGMVESMHRMLNHGITTLVSSDRTRWDEELAQVLFAIRVRKHSVTQYSPFKLVYGIEPRLFSDGEPPIQVRVPWTEDERKRLVLERTAEGLGELGDIRGAAYKRSLAQRERMRSNADEEDVPYQFMFQVNQWVKRRNFKKEKFQNRWLGPFVVVEQVFPGTYRLMNMDGSMVPNLVNEGHLRAWTERGDEFDSVTPADTLGIDIFEELDDENDVPISGEEVGDTAESLDNDDHYDFQDYSRQEGNNDNSGPSLEPR